MPVALLPAARSTARTKTGFALAAAIALVAVACVGSGGTRPSLEPPADPSFLYPLTGQEAQVLFEVEAHDPEYWRLFTLDTYDGSGWTGADLEGSEGVPLSVPGLLPQSEGDGLPRGTTLIQTFRILRAGSSTALPMAQTAERMIAGPIADITWQPARSEAFLDRRLEAGTTYTVHSRIVVPTPEGLERVAWLGGPPSFGRLTALPADLDPRIAEIAKRWTADASSDYRAVLAIQQRFQEEDFTYSTAVDDAVGDTALVDFLTRTKTGFCNHYSSAMAVMLRTLGLPTRIGVGFRAGTRQEDGSFLVTSADAHSWVEVYFPRYGWLQFEPEHGAVHPNAQPGTYLNPAHREGSGARDGTSG